MSRIAFFENVRGHRAPRVSGDEPGVCYAWKEGVECSPRERG